MEEEPVASAQNGLPPPSRETDSLEEDLHPFRFSCLNKWFLYKTNDATGTGTKKQNLRTFYLINLYMNPRQYLT